MRIPYSLEQGIILAEQGILAGNREFYRPELKSRRMRFSAQGSLSNVRCTPESPRGEQHVCFVPKADIAAR
jgi:hypothetical protein